MNISKQVFAARVGRAGEFLAMSKLELSGHRCHHVNTVADDVWIKLSSGKIVTLQVKTSAKLQPHSHKYLFYTKPAKNIVKSNVFAFVVLDKGLVYFMKRSDHRLKHYNTRIHKDDFTQANENKTMKKVFS